MKKNKECCCACGCGQETLRTPADAVMALCIMALSTDGRLHKRELELLDTMVSMSPLFSGVKHAREYAACLSGVLAGIGRDAAVRQAAALLPERLAETAYAWAALMAQADGKVVRPEHKFLGEVRKALGLHGVLAGKINAVTAMVSRRK